MTVSPTPLLRSMDSSAFSHGSAVPARGARKKVREGVLIIDWLTEGCLEEDFQCTG